MVILRFNTALIAQEIAYMLKGKQFREFVVLSKRDQPAIDLAIALTGGKLMHQSQPTQVLMTIMLGLLVGHGMIAIGQLASSISQNLDLDIKISEPSHLPDTAQ